MRRPLGLPISGGILMKARFVSMVLSLASLLLVGSLQAQDKPAPKSPEQLAIEAQMVRQAAIEAQKELARQFADFQKSLQILKNRLDRSDNDQDKRRAAQLQQVLDKADSEDIRNRFVRLQNHLAKKDFEVNEYEEAARQQRELAKILADLVDMFETRDNELSKRIQEHKDALKALEILIKEQQRALDLTQQGQTEKKELKNIQKDVKEGAQEVKNILEDKN